MSSEVIQLIILQHDSESFSVDDINKDENIVWFLMITNPIPLSETVSLSLDVAHHTIKSQITVSETLASPITVQLQKSAVSIAMSIRKK